MPIPPSRQWEGEGGWHCKTSEQVSCCIVKMAARLHRRKPALIGGACAKIIASRGPYPTFTFRVTPTSFHSVKALRTGFSGFLILLFGIFWMGCTQDSRDQTGSRPPGILRPEGNARGATHDLAVDESFGGHTLTRHVGRSDAQLRERLEREAHITAASTYTDRKAAEKTVTAALEQHQSQINSWLRRNGGHRNLVLDYDSSEPVGKTFNRNHSEAVPCAHAVVVLRWISPEKFYILTTYPECRP